MLVFGFEGAGLLMLHDTVNRIEQLSAEKTVKNTEGIRYAIKSNKTLHDESWGRLMLEI